MVAAAGTLATLVYLAARIRQNTTSVRAATVQSVIGSSAAFVETLYRDPDLAWWRESRGFYNAALVSSIDAKLAEGNLPEALELSFFALDR